MAYRNPDTGLARGREGFRRRTAERRAQNLCPKCGKAPPEPDRSLCELCAEKRRKAERAREAKRRALGQKRYTNPEKERARNRNRYRQQTAERLAQGLCPKCGKEELPHGRRLCESCGGKRRKAERARYLKAKASSKLYGGKDPNLCRRIARERSKQRFHARLDVGLCTRCGHRPLAEGAPPVRCAVTPGGRLKGSNMARGGPKVSAAAAVDQPMTAGPGVAHAPSSRPGAIGGRMPVAESVTPGGAPDGYVPTAVNLLLEHPGVSRVHAARMCARASIAGYRSIHRSSLSSRSRRRRITGPLIVGKRSRCAWASHGCLLRKLKS